jgi:hypothetical protein
MGTEKEPQFHLDGAVWSNFQNAATDSLVIKFTDSGFDNSANPGRIFDAQIGGVLGPPAVSLNYTAYYDQATAANIIIN